MIEQCRPCLYHPLVSHLQLFSISTFVLKVHVKGIADHINAQSDGLLFIILDLSTTINVCKFTFPKFSCSLITGSSWARLGMVLHPKKHTPNKQAKTKQTKKTDKLKNLWKIMNLFTIYRNLLRWSKGTIK